MTHRDIARAVLAVVLASGIHAQTNAKTNDDPDLRIDTDPGDRVLTYDFPANHVGIAEYPDGPTGVTVLHFPDGAIMSLDVRGVRLVWWATTVTSTRSASRADPCLGSKP